VRAGHGGRRRVVALAPGAEPLEGRRLLAGVADAFASATPIELDPTGTAGRPGSIDAPGHSVLYSFVAPLSAELVIRQEASPNSTLDSILTVYDDRQQPITSNDDANDHTHDSLVGLKAVAGRLYYLRAAAYGDSTGAYELLIEPATDDFGNTPAQATPIPRKRNGSAGITGAIDYPGDVDVFSFVAKSTRGLEVRLSAAPGSDLNTLLTVLDADGMPIASNDDAGPKTFDSLVRFDAVAGQVYYLRARASPYQNTSGLDATGAYRLKITPVAAVHDDLAHAAPLTLDDTGSAGVSGRVHASDEAQFYRVVAPADGGLTIRMAAAPGSHLDSVLTVYDDQGQPIASNDDVASGTLDSEVQLNVAAGRAYVIRATGYNGTVGRFELTLDLGARFPDDYGDTFDTAHPIALDASGQASLTGVINTSGDIDVFSFMAPADGGLTVRQSAAPGSRLDSTLTVYDDQRRPIGSNDDAASGTLDSLVRVNVVAGRTYDVVAGGVGGSVGRYVLSLALGPHFPTFSEVSAPVAIGPPGATVEVGGMITAPDRADFYKVVPPVDLGLTITLSAAAGGGLDGAVAVFYGNGRLIVSNNPSAGSHQAQVTLNVHPGNAYYVRAESSDATTGGYTLTFGSGPPLADDFPDTSGAAAPLAAHPDGSASEAGAINYVGDVDTFAYVPPFDGTVTVTLDAAGRSGVDGILQVYTTDGGLVASNDNATPDTVNSRLQFAAVAGRTYILTASGKGSTTGKYLLAVSEVAADDVPDTFDGAVLIPIGADGSGTRAGTIGTPDDVDFFRVTAPFTGRLSVRLSPASGSDLLGVMAAFDGARRPVAAGPGGDTPLRFDVVAGDTYYIRVSGRDGTTGGYVMGLVAERETAGATGAVTVSVAARASTGDGGSTAVATAPAPAPPPRAAATGGVAGVVSNLGASAVGSALALGPAASGPSAEHSGMEMAPHEAPTPHAEPDPTAASLLNSALSPLRAGEGADARAQAQEIFDALIQSSLPAPRPGPGEAGPPPSGADAVPERGDGIPLHEVPPPGTDPGARADEATDGRPAPAASAFLAGIWWAWRDRGPRRRGRRVRTRRSSTRPDRPPASEPDA
jgi:hypothetical protein